MRPLPALVAAVSAIVFAGIPSGTEAKKPRTVTASFLGTATYATDSGCDKLKALAAGAPRNLNTVPETLSASGFDDWEGGCSFSRITEVKKGHLYKARMACGESADEWVETDTFALTDNGATVTVTVSGGDEKTTVFKRCDVAAPAAKR